MSPKIIAVNKSQTHTFNKYTCDKIELIEGQGIMGDAHSGKTVKHRYLVRKDPTQPNLRQIHLIQSELFEELKLKGFDVKPGQMGENITTIGVNLLDLPTGAILIAGTAEIVITGLRSPCKLLNSIQEGMMKAVLDKDDQGNLIRKAGIMGIVKASGEIKKGDDIQIILPPEPRKGLDVV